jgi:tetratricopeptide (TPR) repeat protein
MNWGCICIIPAALLCAAAEPQADTDAPCDRGQIASLRREGREAMRGRQYDVAVERLVEAVAACPSNRQLLVDLAQAHLARKDFAQAISTMKTYLEGEPESVEGRLMLANAYFMSGRLREALGEAEGVLEGNAGNATALAIKGNASYLLGNFSEAQDAFIEAMRRHPNNEEAPYMLGRIYYQEHYVDLAIGQFERVLRLNPASYKALDNLGVCYEAKGENDKATGYFLAAIKLVEKDHPEYDWPYANLADLLLKTGDNRKAYDAAAKAANRNPNSARNFYLGGKALCNLGKTDLCLNWLERSAALDPSYPEPLYLLARVYHQLGQEQKAADARKKFLEAQAKVRDRRR